MTEAPVNVLRAIARQFGTPTYAYDLGRIHTQIARLREHLPPAVQILYSLKANASLGLCGYFAGHGLGADVASAGELLTAVEAGFAPQRIFLSGPDKSPPVLARLQSMPDTIISVDSPSELQILAGLNTPLRAVLRLRPDFCSHAVCAAGADSRFGFLFEDLPECRNSLAASAVRVIGFHVFAGSQVLDAQGVVQHFRGAWDLAARAAQVLGFKPELVNLGGGFGVPYGPGDQEPDLGAIADELRSLTALSGATQLVIELGRYLIAQSGWYLTKVIARQKHGGREAVVVDGGVHQRGDLCGLGLRTHGFPPTVLSGQAAPAFPTDVLGCLSLPGDVLAEASPLPPLALGDVLAFANAGAYGLLASPSRFHGHPLPAEVAFDGTRFEVLRVRQEVQSLLEEQRRLHTLRRGVE